MRWKYIVGLLLFCFSVFFIIFGIYEVTSNDISKIVSFINTKVEKEQKKEILSVSKKNVSDNNFEFFKVKRIIDGDTIELENGMVVRYIGINTPETVDPRRPVECFGRQASNQNKELVEGKMVRLEKDVSRSDKYNRLLRYVYFNDLFVNEYLVKEGFAYQSTYPPDVKYQKTFQEAERLARESKKGLWNACK